MSDTDKHFDHLQKLIHLEESEEIRRFKESFLDLSPSQRETAGKALLRMVLTECHYSPGGHRLLNFQYEHGKTLPLYSPETGDMLSITDEFEIEMQTIMGTVYDKSHHEITIAVRDQLPEWVRENAIYHLNIAGSRSTYKKINETLRKVKQAKNDRLAFFRDLSFGLRKPESADPLVPDHLPFLNQSLNFSQKEAVAKAIAVKDVAVIHGPPGTGKTTVLVEIIRQSIGQNLFVFACAPSNTACDHLLESLHRFHVPVLRLGHPARIMDHLRHLTLDFQLANHPLTSQLYELEQRLEQLFDKKSRARQTREEKSEDIQALKQEIRDIDDQIFKQVTNSAAVIIGTLSSSDERFLRKRKIDVLVMDEATQSTEPMAWIPILTAEKVILAGDHYQLPPTIISKDAEAEGLNRTLFERFHQILPAEAKALLRVQYRMNEKIMTFSSKKFYQNQLIADDSVKAHVLADMPEVKPAPATLEPFIFLDTAGQGYEERLEPGSQSRFNPEEANLVVRRLKELLDLGVPHSSIAIISPYSAQVRLLRHLIPNKEIEVDSVDGFQGREKDLVILSLVRSNVEGDLGFLNDIRRMNVAMTRARRKLLIIGDSSTLSNIPFYEDVLKYAESIEAYRSSWEEA
jgi:ATP-dependent RNA/DNA helicase IGHMBP2